MLSRRSALMLTTNRKMRKILNRYRNWLDSDKNYGRVQNTCLWVAVCAALAADRYPVYPYIWVSVACLMGAISLSAYFLVIGGKDDKSKT